MPKFSYGWIPDVHDSRDRVYSAPIADLRALPPSVDISSKLPTPYNQANLGSCTWNATAMAVHWNMRQQGMVDFTPSRLFGYYNTRSLEGTVNQDSGASIRNAIKAGVQWGYCREKPHENMPYWGYDIARYRERPPQMCYDWAAPNRIKDYARVQQTPEQFKAVLASEELIVFGFSVFPSFESVGSSGRVPMPTRREMLMGPIGGHAVAACGYDDASQLVKFINSYGTSWGDKGHGYLPYAYLFDPSLAADPWLIRTIPQGEPIPDPAPPPAPTPAPATKLGKVTIDPETGIITAEGRWTFKQ